MAFPQQNMTQWVRFRKTIFIIFCLLDPAPASTSTNVEELQKTLLDETKSMWDRYRAMFALRNLNTNESIEALAKGLAFEKKLRIF